MVFFYLSICLYVLSYTKSNGMKEDQWRKHLLYCDDIDFMIIIRIKGNELLSYHTNLFDHIRCDTPPLWCFLFRSIPPQEDLHVFALYFTSYIKLFSKYAHIHTWASQFI